MKKNVFFWFTPIFRWLALGILLVAVLAACSGSGDISDASSIPTASSQNAHTQPILYDLQGVQQGQTTVFTLPNRTRIKNLVSIQSNVWFGEYDRNKIGEMNKQGKFSEYTLPTANAWPGWGTPGMDDNFWFSEEGANRIAEMSSQGALTEYTIPTANAGPAQMVLWGDMVWFTETAAHKLGHINQSHQIVEFSLQSAPDQMVTAGAEQSNGQIWFTEPATRSVGHITFDGQISDFPLPNVVTNLGSVVGDGDGNLWFATGQSTKSQIGSVTPDGHFTFFSTGRQNAVAQLIHDGNTIEFIEHNSNSIWTINKQGVIKMLLAGAAGVANLRLPTPLIPDANDGSYWYAKTDDQQSQLWNLNISPYGP